MKNIMVVSLFIFTLSRVAFSQLPAIYTQVAGSGPPVILIPGYSCSGDVWNETVEHLSGRYECHIITIAGFAGNPPLPEGVPVLETAKNELVQYILGMRNKPIVIGHSLGAFMSLWVSSEIPARIKKVICVDGVPAIAALGNATVNYDSLKRSDTYQMDSVIAHFKALPDSGYVENMIGSLLWQVNDTARARQIAGWSYKSDRATLGSTIVEMSLTDLRPALGRIQCPVLVLGSIYYTRENSYVLLEQQFKEIKRHTIKVAQSKHFIMYDVPEWFYKELDSFMK